MLLCTLVQSSPKLQQRIPQGCCCWFVFLLLPPFGLLLISAGRLIRLLLHIQSIEPPSGTSLFPSQRHPLPQHGVGEFVACLSVDLYACSHQSTRTPSKNTDRERGDAGGVFISTVRMFNKMFRSQAQVCARMWAKLNQVVKRKSLIFRIRTLFFFSSTAGSASCEPSRCAKGW